MLLGVNSSAPSRTWWSAVMLQTPSKKAARPVTHRVAAQQPFVATGGSHTSAHSPADFQVSTTAGVVIPMLQHGAGAASRAHAYGSAWHMTWPLTRAAQRC
jgi:hypothetical protein